MSARNKAVLEQANAAITRGDIEGFLVHCTDDLQWTAVGDSTIHGKAAVRTWMQANYVEPPVFGVSQLVAEDDMLVALGEIESRDADGRVVRNAYSDVWRLRDGKLAELRAFVVELPAT
ncbi:MAG TPA: nuclear transport factor 2 family protein [Luteimonas sp.]|nr:nuclear transport factor 2 family protein [Luteimonas sp.]